MYLTEILRHYKEKPVGNFAMRVCHNGSATRICKCNSSGQLSVDVIRDDGCFSDLHLTVEDIKSDIWEEYREW